MNAEVVSSLVATLILIKLGNNHLCFKSWTHRARFEANKETYSCIPGEPWRESWKINYYLAEGSDHARSSKGSKGSDRQWEHYKIFLCGKLVKIILCWQCPIRLKTLQPCQNPIYLILNNTTKSWNQLILNSMHLGKKCRSKQSSQIPKRGQVEPIFSGHCVCSQFWSILCIRVFRCWENVVP